MLEGESAALPTSARAARDRHGGVTAHGATTATASSLLAGASSLDITARPSAVLPVSPGQALMARVVEAGRGQVELALAGGRVRAATSLPLEAGQTLRLVVAAAGPDRVVLRPAVPAAAPATAGLPAGAAAALTASLPGGMDAATLVRLAGEARSAGVATPGAASAFARLTSAGLPVSPAAVAGLATLVEGAPIGQALAALVSSLPETGRAAGAGAPPPMATPTPAPVATPVSAPIAPTTAVSLVAAPPAGGGPGTGVPVVTAPAPGIGAGAPATGSVAPSASAGVAAPPRPSPLAAQVAAPPGGASTTPTPVAAPAADPALAELLRQLIATVSARSVAGDGAHVARAAGELGHGLEARLARDPSSVDGLPLRAALMALANDPDTAPALARQAAGIADAIAAQALAGALPRPGDDPGAGQGAYLQLPLPGGDTVEVHVNPDANDGADGACGPRRLAFLLHLSALGPIMVEVVVGAGGAEAVIRTQSPEAGGFLATRTGELARGLREAGIVPDARVRVEPTPRPVPERLVDPPPSTGLDLTA